MLASNAVMVSEVFVAKASAVFTHSIGWSNGSIADLGWAQKELIRQSIANELRSNGIYCSCTAILGLLIYIIAAELRFAWCGPIVGECDPSVQSRTPLIFFLGVEFENSCETGWRHQTLLALQSVVTISTFVLCILNYQYYAVKYDDWVLDRVILPNQPIHTSFFFPKVL